MLEEMVSILLNLLTNHFSKLISKEQIQKNATLTMQKDKLSHGGANVLFRLLSLSLSPV